MGENSENDLNSANQRGSIGEEELAQRKKKSRGCEDELKGTFRPSIGNSRCAVNIGRRYARVNLDKNTPLTPKASGPCFTPNTHLTPKTSRPCFTPLSYEKKSGCKSCPRPRALNMGYSISHANIESPMVAGKVGVARRGAAEREKEVELRCDFNFTCDRGGREGDGKGDVGDCKESRRQSYIPSKVKVSREEDGLNRESEKVELEGEGQKQPVMKRLSFRKYANTLCEESFGKLTFQSLFSSSKTYIVPESLDSEVPLRMDEIAAWVIFGQEDPAVTKAFIFAFPHFKFTPKRLFEVIKGLYKCPPDIYLNMACKLPEAQQRVVEFLVNWVTLCSRTDFDVTSSRSKGDEEYKVSSKHYVEFLTLVRDRARGSVQKQPPVQETTFGAYGGSSKKMRLDRGVQEEGGRLRSGSVMKAEVGQLELIASQLSAYEFEVFKAIALTELIDQSWNDADSGKVRAPTVTKFIEHTNRISSLVTAEVTKGKTARLQVEQIKKYIHLGKYMQVLGNFNGVMEVLAGLISGEVQKLSSAWKLLKSKHETSMKKLEELMAPHRNYGSYRAKVGRVKMIYPVIPCLQIHLSDVARLMNGTENVGDKLILSKVINLGKILVQLQTWQSQPNKYRYRVDIEQLLKKLVECDRERGASGKN
ncbi:ras guanine nucleotide exchange factor A-like [Schistocerca gregaria]|uniref:ras guanine nucleotide exchange factor A-like n=1 Tax=Schistocerca gregaria TaxID=7010 RepID=UPI00211DC747|nr:ras guanine nucleotide exchange factor A-like [Schistocerca gregaria]